MAKRRAAKRTHEKRARGATAPDARVTSADPKDKHDLARVEARMHALLARGEATAWDVGKLIDEVAARGLHHAEKFTTLEQWADARFPQGWGTLKRYRRVAQAFTRATTKKHGTWKLALGLQYIEATPEHEKPGEIPRLLVRVPAKSGKAMELIPFVECKTKDLERAIEAALSKPDAYDDKAEANAKRARMEAQAAVAAPKGVHLHAPLVRAHPHPEHPELVRYDVVGIDESDLARVARALLAIAKKRSHGTKGRRGSVPDRGARAKKSRSHG